MNIKITVKMILLCCIHFVVAGNAVAEVLDQEIKATKLTLTPVENKMLAWVESNKADILLDLKTHVEMNTGTENIAGIDLYRELMSKELNELGFSLQTHSSKSMQVLSCSGGELEFADHLVATLENNGDSKKTNRILLNGHMDTVFPSDDEFQQLVIEKDGTLKGPGVADMKGGNIVMLYALKALATQGRLDNSTLTVLLNSDEEIGSLSSRTLVEDLARKHDVGFVFESSDLNRHTRARKGLGQVRVKVTGRESHAGSAHQKGVSANLELAHKIIEIEQLTDYAEKITVNTGVMAGGEKRNTVPGCADAYIDLRYPTLASGTELTNKIARITAKSSTSNKLFPELPKVESWAVLHRPAKEPHKKVDQLIAESMGLSAIIGEPIIGTRYSGGGTDGSIMQSVGLPTLDSMGVNGSGGHSSREQTTIKSLLARTKLAAVMISREIDKIRQ